MGSALQVQPSGLDHQVAESMAQLGYVGQSVFNNMHMLPHSMQQDLVNAVASGNSDLVQAATQAATQRFMAMAQVRVTPLTGRPCWSCTS